MSKPFSVLTVQGVFAQGIFSTKVTFMGRTVHKVFDNLLQKRENDGCLEEKSLSVESFAPSRAAKMKKGARRLFRGYDILEHSGSSRT